MNEITILAKIEDCVLIVNKENLFALSCNKIEDIKCIQVDFKSNKIYPPNSLQIQYKFNPWKQVTEDEKIMYSQILYTEFSDKDIYEKIIIPLIGLTKG